MISFTPIIYDKKTKRQWIIRLIISLVIILSGWVLIFAEQFSEDIIDHMHSGVIAILFTAMYFSVPVFVISVLALLNICIYLKRLEKNNFEVPDNKRAYDNDLSKLPRTEAVENKYAGDSRLGGLISLAVYAVFVTLDIFYQIKWIGIEDDFTFFFVLFMIMHLFFLIFAVILFRQGNTADYVDNTDIAWGRKVRIPIAKTISILVITSIIAVFGLKLADTMTDYMHKSRQQKSVKVISVLSERALADVSDRLI